MFLHENETLQLTKSEINQFHMAGQDFRFTNPCICEWLYPLQGIHIGCCKSSLQLSGQPFFTDKQYFQNVDNVSWKQVLYILFYIYNNFVSLISSRYLVPPNNPSQRLGSWGIGYFYRSAKGFIKPAAKYYTREDATWFPSLSTEVSIGKPRQMHTEPAHYCSVVWLVFTWLAIYE